MRKNVGALRRACCTGYFVQAIINNLLPLFFVLISTNYGISYTELSGLIFINFISQLIVDAASIKLVRLIGTKNSVLLAHALAALGVGGMSFLPYVLPSAYAGFCICIVTYAVGSGLIEVLISPIIDAVPGGDRTGSMSFLHSFYCWGQAITVLVTTVILRFVGASWRLVPLFWVIVPIYNFFNFLSLEVPEIENQEGEKSEISIKNIDYILLLLMMLCAGASEIAMSQWASAFSESVLGIDKSTGDLLGPCMFAVLMGTGRLLFSIFPNKFSVFSLLIFSGGLCTVCYLTAALSPFPVLALASCAVCGISVSIMWPAVLSLAAIRFKNGGALLFGTAAMFGDLGCIAGPNVAGMIADVKGFSAGFCAVSIFPVLMIISTVILKNRQKGVNRI